jgi:predicted permease
MTAIAFPGLSDGVGQTTERLMTMYGVLMGGVAMLLLLACANAANLLLGRNLGRRRALALRGAVGATRGRLFRELIVEATIISVAAGGVGLAIGAVLSGLFRGARLLSYLPALDTIALDWRVVAATFTAAAGTVFAFAVIPAWLASGTNPQDHLRETVRTSSRTSVLRPTLMATQVAISLALLVGTTLLARTVAHLRAVDLGFDVRDVLAVDLRPALGRAGAVLIETRDDLGARVGNNEAAILDFSLLGGTTTTTVVREGEAPTNATRLSTHAVSASFFAVMRMPILAGRAFTSVEANAQEQGPDMPVVLGESAARGLYGSPTDAIGRTLSLIAGRRQARWHVVGVTNDVAGFDLRAGRKPSAFVPYARNTRIGTILLRTSLDPGEATTLVRDSIRRVDRSVPVSTLTPLTDLVDAQLAQELLLARLGGVVAAIAALLALAGVYSVMAFFVSERTREIGIRCALGATGSRVAGQVFRRVLAIGLIGLVFGVGLTTIAARSLSSWLFGIAPFDPLTLVAAATLLLVSALIAATIPARRASRVDPVIALRAE